MRALTVNGETVVKNKYKKIINNQILFEKYVESELYEYILRTFKENIKNKKVEYEDLAPLFYIQNKFWGNINNIKLEHIVIDEAQDLGEFQFYNFKELVKPNMSMTILGDIAQGIYSYKGTNNWQKLNQNVFNNQASIEVLKESYRTSMEIMNEANTVINKFTDNENIILAQPIERHGDEVQHWKVDSENNKIIKKFLLPGEEACVIFPYVKGSKIYSFCNKHGLWSKEVE